MLRGVKMLCPVWSLAVAVLCTLTMEVSSQCWESSHCQDLSTEENMLECIQLCRPELTLEAPVYPGEGHLLQPPELEGTDADSLAVLKLASAGSPEVKQRSYSMGHFRWGQPMEQKRRPVKVPKESAELLPGEMPPSALGVADYGEAPEEERAALAGPLPLPLPQKKDGSYRMSHFRWSGPPASKRYGGFMSQKPPLTLFKSAIGEDGQEKTSQ
ncbi:pro-opiomelanocortin-1-like [Sardina pilchardus]|uniref:pro-opiomelanocortin-1-like n=1 Tax=Sardina pilchardus TaxID=27697 RepID=UPI002E147DAF